MITVDERAAAWIRTAVLPPHYADHFEALIIFCACQWGPCGHCDAGRHEQCARRRADLRDWKPASADTYVTDLRGMARTPVWRANGPACRWRCPCTTCARRAALPPDSFERLPPPRRQRENQPALF